MAAKCRVGMEAIIERNLGKWNDKGSNEYYHGGTIRQVPLGTHGTVMAWDGKFLVLNLKDGLKWTVHEDELMPVPKMMSINFLEKVKKLERHPLFELAEQNPVFVVEGRVYNSTDLGFKETFWSKLGLAKPRKANAVEVASLASLDELALERNKNKLGQISDEYAKQVWAYVPTSVQGYAKELELVRFIFAKVFPYFRDDEHRKKVSELLGEGAGKQEARAENQASRELEKVADQALIAISEFTNQVRGKEYSGGRKEARKLDLLLGDIKLSYKPESLLEKVTNGKNIALVNGKCYTLNSVDGEPKRDSVCISGRRFELEEIGKAKDIEEAYQLGVSREAQLDVLTNRFSRDNILKFLREQFGEFVDIIGKKEYFEQDFGFQAATDGTGIYYVYLNIPSFGIKCSGGHNYLFNQSKIGIKLSPPQNSGEAVRYDVRGIYRFHDGCWDSICLGDASQYLPVTGKDSGEVIAKRLRYVRSMFLAADTGDWYGRHYVDTTDSYLKVLGVPIIQK